MICADHTPWWRTRAIFLSLLIFLLRRHLNRVRIRRRTQSSDNSRTLTQAHALIPHNEMGTPKSSARTYRVYYINTTWFITFALFLSHIKILNIQRWCCRFLLPKSWIHRTRSLLKWCQYRKYIILIVEIRARISKQMLLFYKRNGNLIYFKLFSF